MRTVSFILYGSLIFHGLISSHPVANGEKCLSCNEVIEPRHCNVAVECSQGEYCFTQKYQETSGEILYNVGCMDNITCATLIGNSAPIQSYNGHQQLNTQRVSCQQCCKGSVCNVNGCNANAYPTDKGLLCFQCKQHRNAGNCLTFEECFGIGARCFLETFVEYGDKFFQHGCSTYKHCSSIIETGKSPSNIFGKKRQVKSVHVLNRTCCDSDFCNDGKDISMHKNTDQIVDKKPDIVIQKGEGNHYGKEFFLSFPSSSNDTDMVEILLTGMKDAIVTFESQVVAVNRTVSVLASQGLSVFLPKDVVHYSNITAITYKTVKVLSDQNISVFVILYQHEVASDGYLAIPTQTLGRNYSFALPVNSQAAITASVDFTNIAINMFQLDNSTRSATFTASKSQTLFVYLGEFIYGYIEASSNVNVVYSSAKEFHVIDGPLPLRSQQSFVLPYTSFSNGFACTVGKKHVHSLNFSQAPDMKRPLLYIFSDEKKSPITVITDGAMGCLTSTNPGEAMAYIPPISSYSNNFVFRTPTATGYAHHATIISRKQITNGIFDNGKMLKIYESNEVQFENEIFEIVSANMTSGKHIIAHADPKAKFGLILHGFSSSYPDVAYAYPAGFEMHI